MSGLASPCCYRHSSKALSCAVHGDDFVVAGVETDLAWPRRPMEKSFLVKVIVRLGGNKQDAPSTQSFLSQKGDEVGLEADPRHQEILISELEQDVRGLSTPAGKNQQRKDVLGDGDESPLDDAETHSLCELPRTGPIRSGVRNQGVVPKDVGANESRYQRSPPACPGSYCHRSAQCTSFRGTLKGTWMSVWTLIWRVVLPKGGDVELCRSRTAWNRQGHHGSAAWYPERWPRPLPEHDTEHAYRLGSCRRGSVGELVLGGSDTSLLGNCGSKKVCGEETFRCSKSGVMQTQRTR